MGPQPGSSIFFENPQPPDFLNQAVVYALSVDQIVHNFALKLSFSLYPMTAMLMKEQTTLSAGLCNLTFSKD